jgi:murein DD-endopeptidase MepM/ murein hydrolase activator NlpD
VVNVLPRRTRLRPFRAFAVTVAGALLATAVGTAPLALADDHGNNLHQKKTDELKSQKHQVQHQLNGAHQDLDESSAQLQQATAALQSAQTQLSQARAHLAETEGQLAAAEALDKEMQAKLDAAVRRLHDARHDLAAGRRKVAGQQDALGNIVVQNYQSGDPSLMGLSMVLTTQDPAQLTGQLNSVQNVIDKESVVLDRLQATKALLTVQEGQVAALKKQVAKQRKAAAENLLVKQGLQQQAQAAEESVSNLVVLRQTAQQEAAKARAADMAQLQSLQQEQTRISSILKKRAEEARRRAAAAAARAAASSGGPILGDNGPVHSNGFLNYPVAGPVTSPFGWRIHPIYGYRSLHDGIDIAAACGTPVRAPAGGRVLERYYQTAWGNRIIIDHGYHHGASVATIINHMNAPALVGPGQRVHRGQIIGYIGTTGWSTGCHTHFTVMQNGVAVNPMNWL